MSVKRIQTLGMMLTALFGAVALAQADTITPVAVSATLDVGESATITKTVTVTKDTPTSSKVDVYFLADTTGSMYSYIDTVRTSASSILSSVAALGADVQYAVGEYKDFPISPYGGGSDFAYRLNTPMTASTTAVQDGIDMWVASGGADGPESQLAALEALSQSASAAVGWRTGSEKILVWFGDAPGHDPDLDAGYPGPTQADTTAALQSMGIQVEAVDVYGPGNGIDGNGNQASEIATATGGHIYYNIAAGDVDDVIISAITTAFETYTTVSLDLSEVPAGVTVAAVPGSHLGSYDRSMDRSFDFDVTFTGDSPGDYAFNIYATVDGGRVATEEDHITVPGGPEVPDTGTTLLLLGMGAGCLAALRRRVS